MLYFIADLVALGCINAVIVLGFNLQYGYAGILNMTYYTFVAIGAYMTAVTTMGHQPAGYGQETYILQWSLPWFLGLLVGGIASAFLGLFVVSVAVRRLRSDYLAIVTVSLGFIIWVLITNDPRIFDGANGVYGVPQIAGTESWSGELYTLLFMGLSLALLVAVAIIARRIFRSPYGRLLRGLREDEIVALSFGKPVLEARIFIFVLSSFIAGLAGGLLVLYIGAWSPDAFLPLETFFFLAAMIIGGSGNYLGSIVGAFLVVELLNEATRFTPSLGQPQDAGAIRGILIGIAFILVLRFRPAGLIRENSASFYGRVRRLAALRDLTPRIRSWLPRRPA